MIAPPRGRQARGLWAAYDSGMYVQKWARTAATKQDQCVVPRGCLYMDVCVWETCAGPPVSWQVSFKLDQKHQFVPPALSGRLPSACWGGCFSTVAGQMVSAEGKARG